MLAFPRWRVALVICLLLPLLLRLLLVFAQGEFKTHLADLCAQWAKGAEERDSPPSPPKFQLFWAVVWQLGGQGLQGEPMQLLG